MSEKKSAQPLLFGAPLLPDRARLAELTAEVLSSGWLTNGGAVHMRLEQGLTEREDERDTASLTSSGTVALMLALGLGRLKPGAEVITTPLTFAATAQAIAWNGLKPVFADVEPQTLTLCPRAVEAAITPRTAAILPVHFLGTTCDVHAMADIARRHGLWLVYDAAHAFGVMQDGQPIGHFGDASAFSLHATKLLHTGEGGYLVTRTERAQELRRMRNFGLDRGLPAGPGMNGKMSEFSAAVGLALWPDLAAEIASRKALRRAYDAALAGVPGLRQNSVRVGSSESLIYYALRLAPALRKKLHFALADAGIFARDHFPLLCAPGTQWAGADIVTADGKAANAPELGPEVLCLPFHGRITAADVTRISAIAQSILGASNDARGSRAKGIAG